MNERCAAPPPSAFLCHRRRVPFAPGGRRVSTFQRALPMAVKTLRATRCGLALQWGSTQTLPAQSRLEVRRACLHRSCRSCRRAKACTSVGGASRAAPGADTRAPTRAQTLKRTWPQPIGAFRSLRQAARLRRTGRSARCSARAARAVRPLHARLRARSGSHLNARTHERARTRMRAVPTRTRAESDRDGDRDLVWSRTNARAHTQLSCGRPSRTRRRSAMRST
jgi:hypothetical protein